jgi:hypothetical protein
MTASRRIPKSEEVERFQNEAKAWNERKNEYDHTVLLQMNRCHFELKREGRVL